MDFTKMKMQQVYSPPIAVIYGGPGIGKTAFGIGADFESNYHTGKDDHLLINIDYRGADRLVCNRASDMLEHPIASTVDIDTIFRNLAEQKHSIAWIIFDDLSSLEELFVNEVCSENKVSEINKIEYGRGYELARVKWYHLFHLIKDLQAIKPIGAILIGHNKVENQKDPMSESYSRHDLQLDKKSKEIIKKSVDLIGFAHKKTKTKQVSGAFGTKEIVPVGKSERVITFAPDLDGFESKDRFNLAEEIVLDWTVFETELNKAISRDTVKITKNKKGE
jgi:hypothetical protein